MKTFVPGLKVEAEFVDFLVLQAGISEPIDIVYINLWRHGQLKEKDLEVRAGIDQREITFNQRHGRVKYKSVEA